MSMYGGAGGAMGTPSNGLAMGQSPFPWQGGQAQGTMVGGAGGSGSPNMVNGPRGGMGGGMMGGMEVNPFMGGLRQQIRQNNPDWNRQQITDRANQLKQTYAPGNTLNADQTAALQNYMQNAWQGMNQRPGMLGGMWGGGGGFQRGFNGGGQGGGAQPSGPVPYDPYQNFY